MAMSLAILGLPAPGASGASAASGTTRGTAVLKIGSQITLTSSSMQPSPNANVTLTATFTLIAGNTDLPPTGDVTFLDNGVALGTGTLAGATATWNGRLSPGAQSVTASYAGDSDYMAGVSDPLSLSGVQVPVVQISLPGGNGSWLPSDGSWSDPMGITAASDPADGDHPYTQFSVGFSGISGLTPADLRLQEDTGSGWTDVPLTVQPSGALTAMVGVNGDLPPGGSSSVNLRLSAQTSAPAGTLTMDASLLGSPDGAMWSDVLATASQQLTVSNPVVDTITTVSASTYSVVTDGRSAAVTITATVSLVSGGGTPTGSVTFLADGSPVSVAPLSGGTATVSANLALGVHAISATYSGDATDATSTGSAAQQVTVTPPGGSLHPIVPVRMVDTRYNTAANTKGRIAAQSEIVFKVTGAAGIPATGVEGISVNVTVVQPAAAGVVTIYPYGGQIVPATANVDFAAHATTAGLVVTPVDSQGRIAIYNKSNGPVDLIADVSGWFAQPLGSLDAQGRYNPVAPLRLADTRKTGRMKPGQTLSVQVAGMGDIPKTGVGAAVLNVTVVNPSSAAWLALYPGGGTLPHVSTNAFQKGETRAGRVIVGVGSDGKVNVYNSPYESTDVVVDVVGWFTSEASATGGSTFVPLPTSVRMTATQTGGATWGSLSSRAVQIAGVDGIPGMAASIHPTGIVANLHVTAPTLGGYLVTYPLAVRPVASDLNFVSGEAVQNLSIAKLGDTGAFNLFHTAGTTNVTIDLYGWFG
jgi:hypothetical protein